MIALGRFSRRIFWGTQLTNAIMATYDARTLMSTQALNSPTIQRGILDILLNHSRLWEALRGDTPR